MILMIYQNIDGAVFIGAESRSNFKHWEMDITINANPILTLYPERTDYIDIEVYL